MNFNVVSCQLIITPIFLPSYAALTHLREASSLNKWIYFGQSQVLDTITRTPFAATLGMIRRISVADWIKLLADWFFGPREKCLAILTAESTWYHVTIQQSMDDCGFFRRQELVLRELNNKIC
jgi:hypothetical protein